MIWSFFRAASSMSSHACADVDVNGFSTKTCLPFSSARFARSKCVQTGVTMATASISAASSTSAGSVVIRTAGYNFCARFNAFGFRSQIATTSH